MTRCCWLNRGRGTACERATPLKLARRFDPYQRQGLFRFLKFVKPTREAEAGEEPARRLPWMRASAEHSPEQRTRIPVVVAADLGRV